MRNPRGTGKPLSQFCCSQPHTDGRRICAPKRLLEEGQFEARMSWLRNHYRKSHPKLFAKQVKKGVVTRKKMKVSRQNKLVKVTVPWYKKPLLGVLNPTRKGIGDVWKLETPSEDVASDEVNMIAESALGGNRKAQNYLRKLWDNESWSSIKRKLETEGSVWYVWYMDGVYAHMRNW